MTVTPVPLWRVCSGNTVAAGGGDRALLRLPTAVYTLVRVPLALRVGSCRGAFYKEGGRERARQGGREEETRPSAVQLLSCTHVRRSEAVFCAAKLAFGVLSILTLVLQS